MKTLFSKMLLAQVITVVLALIVMSVITRISLNRGFLDYLERQETAVLQAMAPALEELYASQGSWAFLRNNPRAWDRIWRQSRPRPGDRPPSRRAPPADDDFRFRQQDFPLARWMRSLDRPLIRERLFLLDAERRLIAGAQPTDRESVTIEPLRNGEAVVGWIGFTPMGKALPPEARRFLQGQLRLMGITLLAALAVAVVLGLWLARSLSRPVQRISTTVDALSRGNFDARAEILSGDEIGRLGRQVNQLAATLDKNRSARQRWMSEIAHELRTPVAILRGEIEALSDGVRPADQRMAQSLSEEIGQLSALIDDLQTLALADVGALNLQKEAVDLSVLAGQIAETFRIRLAEREITMSADCGQDLGITGDPQRLRQMLHNLMENCARYVRSGERVELRLQGSGGQLEIVLEDSGPGVSDEQLSRLFERFYRGEGSRSRATGGSGLGLAICRNIVEAHGGTIEAGHSGLGGLKIRILLPSE
ncbi:MAG: HAMP domain-containing protein [Gammaproteobacteria bacterium]|nr:HAMP domain-containing protein [Gammaproteobacteria bacterium]NNK33445.1 HAMP domain-containing protein [Xanthomonadales bacterium]